jgi:hypothetical protein
MWEEWERKIIINELQKGLNIILICNEHIEQIEKEFLLVLLDKINECLDCCRSILQFRAIDIPPVGTLYDDATMIKQIFWSTVESLRYNLKHKQQGVYYKFNENEQIARELYGVASFIQVDLIDEIYKVGDIGHEALEALANPLAVKLRNYKKEVADKYNCPSEC